MTTAMIAEVKLDGVFKRFDKFGNDKVKQLLKTIYNNAKSASTRETNKGNTESTRSGKDIPTSKPESAKGLKEPAVSSVPTRVSKVSEIAPSSAVLKRRREIEFEVEQASKKAKAESDSNLKPRPSTVAPGMAKSGIFNRDSNSKVKPAAASTSLGKQISQDGRKISVQPSRSNVFSHLKNANDNAKAPVKKPESKGDTAASSSLSFSDLLSGLKKKPDNKVAPVAPASRQETAEQKRKRERREARGASTVRWRPDSELTAVKIFHRHPEEDDTDAGNSMTRDARDEGKEGQTLRQQLKSGSSDDSEDTREADLRPWYTPSEVDFSAMRLELGTSTVKKQPLRFGGIMKVESLEKIFQDEREMRELGEFYVKASDIPANPKEGPWVHTGPPAEEYNVPFGRPEEFSTSGWWVDREQEVLQRQKTESAKAGHQTRLSDEQMALLSGVNITVQPQVIAQVPALAQAHAYQSPAHTAGIENILQRLNVPQQTPQPEQPSQKGPDIASLLQLLQGSAVPGSLGQLSMPQVPAPNTINPANIPPDFLQALQQLGGQHTTSSANAPFQYGQPSASAQSDGNWENRYQSSRDESWNSQYGDQHRDETQSSRTGGHWDGVHPDRYPKNQDEPMHGYNSETTEQDDQRHGYGRGSYGDRSNDRGGDRGRGGNVDHDRREEQSRPGPRTGDSTPGWKRGGNKSYRSKKKKR
jgi:hypothetical protein